MPKKKYRTYSTTTSYEEQLNQSLGGNYLISKTSDGNYLAQASPLTFTSYKRGSEKRYSTYTPHELVIDPSGNVISEVRRGIYTRDKMKNGYMQSPYDREVINYKDQTKRVYTTRDLRSGRETVQLKEKVEGGYSKKYQVTDQTLDDKKQPSFQAPKSQFRDYRGATYQGSSKDTPSNYMKDIFAKQEAARLQKRQSFSNYAGAERIQNRPDSQRINIMRGLATDQVVSKKQRASIRTVEYATSKDSLAGFEKRIEASNKRQETFFNSPNFQNVRKTARWMTFGNTDVSYEQRSFVGKTAENVVFGLMAGPIAAGGAFPMVGEKLAATGEAIYHKETRGNILPELKRAGKETLSKELNPTTPEGLATYISSGIFATTLLPAARTSYPVRTGMKILYKDKYVPVEKSGIKFVEDYTVKTRLNELRSLEGKTVSNVHVSPRPLPFDKKGEFVTTAFPETAGAFRGKNKLFNFYESSPQVNKPSIIRSYKEIITRNYALNNNNPAVVYLKTKSLQLKLNTQYYTYQAGLLSKGVVNYAANRFSSRPGMFSLRDRFKTYSLQGKLTTQYYGYQAGLLGKQTVNYAGNLFSRQRSMYGAGDFFKTKSLQYGLEGQYYSYQAGLLGKQTVNYAGNLFSRQRSMYGAGDFFKTKSLQYGLEGQYYSYQAGLLGKQTVNYASNLYSRDRGMFSLRDRFKTYSLQGKLTSQYYGYQASLFGRQVKGYASSVYYGMTPLRVNVGKISISRETYLDESYTPRAYLGYAGFSNSISSSAKVIYGKPVVQVLLSENRITPTPRSVSVMSLDSINRWQGKQSGNMFVPAENIKGMSNEGQFILPSKYEGIKGYDEMQGSIVKRNNQRFTYYTQRFENPYTNPVARAGWQLFGKKKEVYKFDLIDVENKPITTSESIVNKPKLDVRKYNEEYYQGQRYARSSSPRYKSFVSSPLVSGSYSSIVSSARSYSSVSRSSSYASSYFRSSSVSSGLSSNPRTSSGSSMSSGRSSIGTSSSTSSIASSTSSSMTNSSTYPYYSYNAGLKRPPKQSSLLRFKGPKMTVASVDRTPQGKRNYAYAPDITSSAFDIEAKLNKRLRFNLQRSGLSIRPLPI